jgi:hypothetical protein
METGNLYVVYDAELYEQYLITKIIITTDSLFKAKKLCRKYKNYQYSIYLKGCYQEK